MPYRHVNYLNSKFRLRMRTVVIINNVIVCEYARYTLAMQTIIRFPAVSIKTLKSARRLQKFWTVVFVEYCYSLRIANNLSPLRFHLRGVESNRSTLNVSFLNGKRSAETKRIPRAATVRAGRGTT